MSIICEIFSDKEILNKTKYAGVEEFVLVRNSSCPEVPQASHWAKHESYFMPIYYRDCAEKIANFEVRPDDVWVVTFPKCGSTWTQEMVWQICNDLDYEGPKRADQNARFPFFEVGSVMSRDLNIPDVVSLLEKKPSPRFIKSHLSAPLLPKQLWTVRPKIVYVSRTAKDAAISFYHHYRNMHHYSGSLEDFLEVFMDDKIIYAPYHRHIIDFWRMRNEENILFLTYEDMKKDHPKVIEQTAKFFGKSFTKEQIQELAEYLSFSNFAKNPSVNHEEGLGKVAEILKLKKPDESYHFVRKGEVGSHQKEMPKDMIEKFNKWTLKEVEKAKLGPEIRNIFM